MPEEGLLFPLIQDVSEKRKEKKTPVESMLTKEDFLGREDIYPTTPETLTAYQGKIIGTVPLVYGGWPQFPYNIVEQRRRTLERAATLKAMKEQEDLLFPNPKMRQAWEPYRKQFTQAAQDDILGLYEKAEKEGKTQQFSDPSSEYGRILTEKVTHYNTIADNSNFIAKQLEKYEQVKKGEPGAYMEPEEYKIIAKLKSGKMPLEDFSKKLPEMMKAVEIRQSRTEMLQKNVYAVLQPAIDQEVAIATNDLITKKKGIPLTNEEITNIKAITTEKYYSPARIENAAESLIYNFENTSYFTVVYPGIYDEENPEIAERQKAKAKDDLIKEITNRYARQVTGLRIPGKGVGLTFSFGTGKTKSYSFISSQEDPIETWKAQGFTTDPLMDYTQIFGKAKKKRIIIGSKTVQNKPIALPDWKNKEFTPVAFEYDDEKRQWFLSGAMKETIEDEYGKEKTIINAKSLPIEEVLKKSFIANYEETDPDVLFRQFFPETMQKTEAKPEQKEKEPEEYTNITTLKDKTGKSFKGGIKNGKWYNIETDTELK